MGVLGVRTVLKSYMQELFADRLGGTNFGTEEVLYKFEKIKRAKIEATLSKPHMNLIDMGIGEPDMMADRQVVQILFSEASKRENRGYTDNGVLAFNKAVSMYMEQTFNVHDIDMKKEVNHCIGAKSALAMLPYAFINPGDITLITKPGYPIMEKHTEWLGGEVVSLPLYKENNFLPDMSMIPREVRKRAKLLYINYPNNPTGAIATREFYEEVVAFAKENNIIVVSDEAYAGLVFDGNRPLSFLSVPGAKEVGVAVHSFSKAFNMAGWRLGFVVGNELIIKAFATIKDNVDSGQFAAIQKAGIYCLEHTEITSSAAHKYSRRLNLLVQVLNDLGFLAKKPKGSFFLYIEAPKGILNGQQFHTAEDFSHFLIKEKLISTVPWDDIGRFVRFSVTFDARDEIEEVQIINEIRNRLSGMKFVW